jgi:SAM-dependent methyltransferase
VTFRQGWNGWDAYAPFYDWENQRTFGRRDVAFWRTLALEERGAVLELGCGTGRLLLPLARAGVRITGIDRSGSMLSHARARLARLPARRRPGLVLGDVRALPFANGSFAMVLAPYGLLQSLLDGRDLTRTLADAARVLTRGGLLGIDLVPDLPAWREYPPTVRLTGRGRDGARVRLVESVRQDRRRGLTIFEEEFVETRRGRSARRRFTLTFRTRSVPRMLASLDRAGFRTASVFGDYRGGPLVAGSDAWLILGRKK